jgi:hypothetical protein
MERVAERNIVRICAKREQPMNGKPLNPKLPGRYGRMTAHQLDAEVAAYERPILLSETRPMTVAEKRQWQRAQRRPARH